MSLSYFGKTLYGPLVSFEVAKPRQCFNLEPMPVATYITRVPSSAFEASESHTASLSSFPAHMGSTGSASNCLPSAPLTIFQTSLTAASTLTPFPAPFSVSVAKAYHLPLFHWMLTS